MDALDETALLQLRYEVRAYIASERQAGRITVGCDSWLAGFDPEFSQRLAERGWVGMTVPTEYGGGGRSAIERFVVTEELLAAGAPVAAHWLADRQTAPGLLRFGTEAQRARYLPGICSGTSYFSAGLSEPDSGSDLASIRTSARRVGPGWVLNGTKVWTSHAHRSHYMVALCRTSPPREERHSGLSQFIVELPSPGVTVRPIRLLSGEHHFNEVQLVDVYVPHHAVIGDVGAGWEQVMAELAFERSGPERFLSTLHLLETTATVLGQDGLELNASEIGSLVANVAALRRMSAGVARSMAAGIPPDTVACAIVKDLGARFERDVVERARLLVDPLTAPEPFRRALYDAVLQTPGFSLRGGTTEILQGLIAKDLGLR